MIEVTLVNECLNDIKNLFLPTEKEKRVAELYSKIYGNLQLKAKLLGKSMYEVEKMERRK